MDAELLNLFWAGLPELMNSPFFAQGLLGFTPPAFRSQSRMSLDCKRGCKCESDERQCRRPLSHSLEDRPEEELLGLEAERAKSEFRLCPSVTVWT